MTDHRCITLDALAFARAFRAAQLLVAEPAEATSLCGVLVEAFGDAGVRLVASNRFALITTWACIPHDLWARGEEEPDIGEAPDWSAVILDPSAVLAEVVPIVQRHVAAALKAEQTPLTLDLAVEQKPQNDQGTFDGLTAEVSRVSYQPVVEGTASVYEGDYPQWRQIMAEKPRGSTDAIELGAQLLGKVCAAAQIMGESIRWDFTSRNGPARWTVDAVLDDSEDPWKHYARSRTGCSGVLMTRRMSVEFAPEADQ